MYLSAFLIGSDTLALLSNKIRVKAEGNKTPVANEKGATNNQSSDAKSSKAMLSPLTSSTSWTA